MSTMPTSRVLLLTLAAWAASTSPAHAQIVNIPFPSTFRGSLEIRGYPSDSTCLPVYTVPAGSNKLRITDMALDSYGSGVALPYQYFCTGKPNCAVARSAYMTAPAGGTLAVAFNTAILVNPGETLSLCNFAGKGRLTSWTLHGYLYSTP